MYFAEIFPKKYLNHFGNITIKDAKGKAPKPLKNN
jgi:hypothetical protein